MKEIKTQSPEETMELAAEIAQGCEVGSVVALVGDLGAGKTTFARGFVGLLAGVEEVVSPTFTIVQPYAAVTESGEETTLYHYDLYRLKDPEELEEIGFEDSLEDSIALIEWPQIAEHLLPEDYILVEIRHGKKANERVIRISGD